MTVIAGTKKPLSEGDPYFLSCGPVTLFTFSNIVNSDNYCVIPSQSSLITLAHEAVHAYLRLQNKRLSKEEMVADLVAQYYALTKGAQKASE